MKLAEKQTALVEARGEAEQKELERAQTRRQIYQDQWEQELDFIKDVGEKQREEFAENATNEELSFKKRTDALNSYKTSYAKFLSAQKNQFASIGLSEEEFDRILGIRDPAELAKAITDIDYLSEVEKNRLREVYIEFKNSKTEQRKVQQEYDKIIADNEAAKREAEAKRKADEKAQEEKEREENKRKEEEDLANSKRLQEERTRNAKRETEKRLAFERQLAYGTVGLLNEVFNAAKTIGQKNEKLQRDLGVVQAIINTGVGVSKALASSPPPLSFINAGAVAIKGAAQVTAIRNASAGGGTSGVGSAPALNTSVETPQTQAIDQQAIQQQALENAIGNLGLTVSVTEINDVQNNVKVSEQISEI